jgi:hypothetical protein
MDFLKFRNSTYKQYDLNMSCPTNKYFFYYLIFLDPVLFHSFWSEKWEKLS